MRFNELRDALSLRLTGPAVRFKDEELQAVLGLVAGPGVVWELEFGSWILMQPGMINSYAQAVIQKLREDEDERGCLPEERVLHGGLSYHRQTTGCQADTAGRRRGRVGSVFRSSHPRRRKRSSSAGMPTSICSKKDRIWCDSGTTCVRTAVRRFAIVTSRGNG
jgi:hypothetical protein